MIRQVVVVLDGGQGDGVAEEAEVVYWDGLGEDGLDCCFIVFDVVSWVLFM